jgi:signal transduction histidine kinase
MGTGEPWDTAAVAARMVSAESAPFFRQVSHPSSGRVWNVGASGMARPEGEEGWVIVTIHDATQIVTLQEALRHSERMAEIGALVSGVAHEVRNPLFTISVSIDTLEAELDTAVVPRATMELMRDAVRRLVALMQDLLDYGRPSTRERAAGSLESVAYEAIRECEPLARASEMEVVSRCAGGVPPLKMDRGRLVRAVQNVIQNAIQHSPARGLVEVTVEQITVPGRSWAVCAVRDTGPGFAEEDVRRVFEPLFSLRPGGTGLGLSIAQKVVEEHGGQIRVETHPAGGGYVTICLPCLDPPAEGP